MSGFDGAVAEFSMGAVVSRTFGILGRNLAAIGAAALLVDLVIITADFAIDRAVAALHLGWHREFATVPAALVGLLLQSIVIGAVTRIAVADLDERRVGLGAAMATGLRLVFPLLGLAILFLLGVGLASVLLVAPGLMVAMRWIVATPVRVIEGPSVSQALSRSTELTMGHRWKLFGLTIAFLILSGTVTFAMDLAGAALAADLPSSLALITVGGVQVISSAITSSVSATGIAVCYVELRRVVEGASFQDVAAVFT